MFRFGKFQHLRKWLALALACLPAFSFAGEVSVTVLDRDGSPVPNVAVYLEGADSEMAEDQTAVMDQVDTQFVPHFLVVQSGTLVEFPNSDVIAHHVYSFSDPNDFMLPLYKGHAHDPIRFEHAGVVILGCNIHDQMLAYILVVDTPQFTKTDAAGKATLSVEMDDSTTVNIWSPRIKPRGEVLSQTVDGNDVVFQLKSRLRPAHAGSSGGVEWSDY